MTIDINNVKDIVVLDDAIPNTEQILQWILDSEGWEHSTTAGGVNELRTSSTLWVPFMSYAIPAFVSDIHRAVWTAMNDYAVQWNISFNGVEPVSVQKYEPGQHYGIHQDNGPSNNRIISAVAYLNDVDEGGETVFPLQDVTVIPKAGRIAIFPSAYPYQHEAKTPVSGVKVAAAYWAFT